MAAQFRQGGYEYPIIVRLKLEDRELVSDVNDVMVNTTSGVSLPVKNVMVIQSQLGPSQIERKNQERLVMVSAEPEIPLSEAIKAVTARLPEIQPSPEFRHRVRRRTGTAGEDVQRAAPRADSRAHSRLRRHGVAVRVAARSVHHHVLCARPRRIGVVLALYLTDTSFNLQAYLGIIMLGGIVVSNGILLVDYTNILRRRDGMELRDAVEVAGRTRLRPILMTALATMLGLVPMALGIGEGSELQVPLARVVIGGLLTSTFITLVIVPTVYTLFEEGLSGLRRKRPTPDTRPRITGFPACHRPFTRARRTGSARPASNILMRKFLLITVAVAVARWRRLRLLPLHAEARSPDDQHRPGHAGRSRRDGRGDRARCRRSRPCRSARRCRARFRS